MILTGHACIGCVGYSLSLAGCQVNSDEPVKGNKMLAVPRDQVRSGWSSKWLCVIIQPIHREMVTLTRHGDYLSKTAFS